MIQDTPRILIVEDEPIIAEDIADLCQLRGHEVCGIAYSASEALGMIEALRPNLVLLDINLNDRIDGTEVGSHLNQHTNIPFIYITSYSDQATLEKVKHTAPLGYIVKPFNKEQIYSTIELAWSQIQQHNTPGWQLAKVNKQLFTPLTERESEVLKCLYTGMENNQISSELYISKNTVKYHIKNLFEKFDVHNRAELVYKLNKMMA